MTQADTKGNVCPVPCALGMPVLWKWMPKLIIPLSFVKTSAQCFFNPNIFYFWTRHTGSLCNLCIFYSLSFHSKIHGKSNSDKESLPELLLTFQVINRLQKAGPSSPQQMTTRSASTCHNEPSKHFKQLWLPFHSTGRVQHRGVCLQPNITLLCPQAVGLESETQKRDGELTFLIATDIMIYKFILEGRETINFMSINLGCSYRIPPTSLFHVCINVHVSSHVCTGFHARTRPRQGEYSSNLQNW